MRDHVNEHLWPKHRVRRVKMGTLEPLRLWTQSQFQNAVPQGGLYQQSLGMVGYYDDAAALQGPGIVAGGCLDLPSGRRIDYETRLAARRRYEEWEQGIQRVQRPQWGWGENLMPRIRRNEWDWGQANNRPEKRSLALLRRHLTDEQWETLGRHGYFKVAGRLRRLGRWQNHLFTVHQHCMIYELEPKGRRHYCIVAMEPGMPDYDWMLMVKMLIESDLRKFYDTAKKRGFNPYGCSQVPF